MAKIQKPSPSKKPPTRSEALTKIYRYCAFQERSHQEVRNKLFEYGLHTGDVDEIMVVLITEGYLNEERFAKTFSGGKFRIKKWGRVKIQRELERRGLTEYCIKRGMEEIDASSYLTVLNEILRKKSGQLEEDNVFKKRDKIARFAIGKGYEAELVWQLVRELISD